MSIKISPRILFTYLILIIFVNSSCRKTQILLPLDEENIISEKFFNDHLSSDENILAIRNNILKEDQRKPFIEKFVKYAGYPIWDKAITKTAVEKSVSTTTMKSGSRNGKVVFIPLALDDEQRVNSIIEVKIQGKDTSFNMIYYWQYKRNGYTKAEKLNNADQIALLFMGFENYVFGA